MSSLPILAKIVNVKHFQEYLASNPGLVIVKFGAKWCNPCKLIEKQVHDYMIHMPNTVQCFIIDIDEYMELYGYLKTKKMVKGVPTILCYYAGNQNYIPDDSVSGGDPKAVDAFFQRCLQSCSH